MSHERIVILEWNSGGHHEGHLSAYVAACLRLGFRVALLCADPDALRAMPANAFWAGMEQADRLAVDRIPPSRFRGKAGRLKSWLAAWRHGRKIRSRLRGLEARLGGSCTAVFFACLYDNQVQVALACVRALGLPWSGMYLQAHWFHDSQRRPLGSHRDFPITRLLADRRLAGLLMLDEGVVEKVRLHTGRPVVLAPDFTDASDGAGHSLGARYRRHAGKRPLVASLGHLQPSKGCATLAELALREDAADLAFLFAGNVIWQVFDPVKKALFVRAITEGPQVIFHGERIPDERAYNSLVQACDVVFAAYVDFPHSSNTLTKAAVFEKPIIVSDGHLMAARVREYRLGEVVPAGDADAALRAIRTLTENPEEWRARVKPRWAEYRERHSLSRLDAALNELLSGGGEGA